MTSIILLTSLLSLVSCVFQFNKQGDFTILQLTDQHYCESIENDLASQNLTRYLLETIEPDLVVFSGDAASGYANGSSEHGWYHNCWLRFTEPIMESGIPYAYILGNHDAEGDLDREEVVQLDQTNPLSVRSECEGIPSKSTFYVPIYSSRDQNELAANIWMFDSGRHGCGSYNNTWGCIDEEQLEWYDHESEKLKHLYGKNINHIAFLHIPIPEYRKLYNNGEFYGVADENVSCSSPDSKFFQHVKKNDDITAMFLGHDHENDFGGWYKGVELVYGRKSGFGGYGETRGARVIKFKEEFTEKGKLKVTRDHFVLYENGTIEDTKILHRRQGDKQKDCPTFNVENDQTIPTFDFKNEHTVTNNILYTIGIISLVVFGVVLQRVL